MTNKMPVVFVGHGSPENAIEDNEFAKGWETLAKRIPKPKMILCISAHWLTEGTAVTAMSKPKTIHDFYGFPKKLYDMEYPAKGSPELAEKIRKTIKAVKVEPDMEWGLDHGTWSVLARMYPKADIPVVQLSLNSHISLARHFEIGEELAELRSDDVLIVGSGNVVHNLMAIGMGAKPYEWALEFDKFVKDSLVEKDFGALVDYQMQKSAMLALPTNEHYLPLLYACGASENEKAEFFNEKIAFGSISMRCVAYGL